ncbi:MAG: RidA family protein [Chloroflexi bacterium]|nr:RidA family protein [Chloroflexota bacterium]
MPKSAVKSQNAPRAIGPYSQAIVSGNLVFCSGQIGLDPATGKLVSGGVAAQTKQAIDNLSAVLEAAGVGLDNVVKTTVFMVDMDDYARINDVYDKAFKVFADFYNQPFPARSAVTVRALPLGALVEIEAIAIRS